MDSEELSPEQRALVDAMEPLWRRAHRIVAARPELDVTDVFHAFAQPATNAFRTAPPGAPS